jgi:hypothetical protein
MGIVRNGAAFAERTVCRASGSRQMPGTRASRGVREKRAFRPEGFEFFMRYDGCIERKSFCTMGFVNGPGPS